MFFSSLVTQATERSASQTLVFEISLVQPGHPLRSWLDSLTQADSKKSENALYEFSSETQTWAMNPLNPSLKGMVLPTFAAERPGVAGSPQTQFKVEEWLKASTENGILRLALKPVKAIGGGGKPLKKFSIGPQAQKNFLAGEFRKLLTQMNPPFFAKPFVEFTPRPLGLEFEGPLANLKLSLQVDPLFQKDSKVSNACNLIKTWLLSRQLVNSNTHPNFQGSLVLECGLLGLNETETGALVMYRLPLPIISGLDRSFPLKTSADTRSVSLLQSLVETPRL